MALGWLKGVGLVLDLGCAEGMFAHLASGDGWQVVGMDVDAASVTNARRQAPRAEFSLGSGEALPFQDRAFDAVVLLDVLEHVPYEERTLREVARVLKPGGRLVISVPHRGTFGFIDAQNSVMFAAGRKVIKGRNGPPRHHKHYSMADLQGLLGPSFKVCRQRYGGYLLLPVLGYLLMFTDALRLARVSEALRHVEQVDFDMDRGERSWHLMAEFAKQG